jgi:hypothetical protein
MKKKDYKWSLLLVSASDKIMFTTPIFVSTTFLLQLIIILHVIRVGNQSPPTNKERLKF